jgi:hypothetical protein
MIVNWSWSCCLCYKEKMSLRASCLLCELELLQADRQYSNSHCCSVPHIFLAAVVRIPPIQFAPSPSEARL